jgi:pyocin large subunit-like protein
MSGGCFLSIDPVTTDANTGGSFNRYAYAVNNPYKYIDPDGRAVETPWDAANVAMDIVSLSRNIAVGNYGGAAVDALGLLIDGIATAVPGVPGGAGTIIQASRTADRIADTAKLNTKVEKTASGARVEDFTPKQLQGAKAENAAANGGTMTCTDCAKPLQSIANQKGVPTPANQAQVHHDPPISKGGTRESSKAVVLCPACHQDRHRNQ